MTSSKVKPRVHLFIPHLLQPLLDWQKNILFEAECPHLSTLLSQYQTQSIPHCSGLVETLFRSLGVQENDEIPAAYYRYQVHSNDSREGQLICADPVHLEVGLNDISLTEAISDLSDEEALELITLLNQHFKDDDVNNIQFLFGTNHQFYLLLADHEKIETTPLEKVLRNSITRVEQASGKTNWQVIQNEIQMLLHSADVNRKREIAGQTTINSLWLWGAGLPLESSVESALAQENKCVVGGMCNCDSVNEGNDLSDGIEGKMIAKLLQCKWESLPDFIEKLTSKDLSELLNGETYIILDQLFKHAVESKPENYQQALSEIDTHVIKPLLALWKDKQIEILIDSCDGKKMKPRHVPAWKFWSKSAPLISLLQKGQI